MLSTSYLSRVYYHSTEDFHYYIFLHLPFLFPPLLGCRKSLEQELKAWSTTCGPYGVRVAKSLKTLRASWVQLVGTFDAPLLSRQHSKLNKDLQALLRKTINNWDRSLSNNEVQQCTCWCKQNIPPLLPVDNPEECKIMTWMKKPTSFLFMSTKKFIKKPNLPPPSLRFYTACLQALSFSSIWSYGIILITLTVQLQNQDSRDGAIAT